MDEQLFNALCDVVIYHFCDCMRTAGDENSKSAKLLVARGIIAETDDASAAYDAYQAMVVEYALDNLPDGYELSADYWGAKCIKRPDQPTKDSSLPFAGSECGNIMWFDNYAALVAYTDEQLTPA
tara:strand:+ start:143 stop:517 length:375 start_codon:yes stop_codon:yes gene_type:complete